MASISAWSLNTTHTHLFLSMAWRWRTRGMTSFPAFSRSLAAHFRAETVQVLVSRSKNWNFAGKLRAIFWKVGGACAGTMLHVPCLSVWGWAEGSKAWAVESSCVGLKVPEREVLVYWWNGYRGSLGEKPQESLLWRHDTSHRQYHHQQICAAKEPRGKRTKAAQQWL